MPREEQPTSSPADDTSAPATGDATRPARSDTKPRPDDLTRPGQGRAPRSEQDDAVTRPEGDDATWSDAEDHTWPAAYDITQSPARDANSEDLTGPSGAPTHTAGAAPAFGAGDAFGGRYRIIKELGAGGMGVVYQAWDEVLNVVVALKVVRPDHMADRAAAREIERQFKRELLLARKVTHKHVVRIHDLGDVDGTKYITMSFVEGEDLVTTLRREGKLPVGRVLRLARQVASGLEAAHDAGVIHRDLKPANIMVDVDGDALIMDFGIALSAGTRTRDAAAVAATLKGGTGAADMTIGGATMGGDALVGAVIGTIDYMSPEQSRGGRVDHRSDLYSFGLILTDLLLGPRSRPEGTTAWEALTDRIAKPPTPLAARNPEVPPAFDAIITRCVQLEPATRFQSAHDLVAALERLDENGDVIPEPRRLTPAMLAAASLLLAALVGGTWWLARGNRPQPVREPMSVLIADFTNSAQDPVFDGLIEQALAVGIESASFLEAYSRRDAMRLARTFKPDARLDEATARLVSIREGLDAIVGGDITARGSGYTLHVKVTRPADEKTLLDWSTRSESKDTVLAAVGEIASRVRRTLGDTQTRNAASAAETFTAGSIEGAKAYAEAQELQWAGRGDEAIAAYQRTLQIDPDFGRAHAGLAALYANQGRVQEAERSYQAALTHLDRMTEREKYRTRGGYYLFKLNGDNAMNEFQALVAQYPSDTSGLANLAFAHFLRRDMKSAREVGVRASDAYPQNVIRRSNAALYAMYAGDFDEATRLANLVLELNPTYPKGFVALGLSQLAGGHVQEAVATYGRLSSIGSPTARAFAATGLIDLALYEGRQRDALTMLDDAITAERAANPGGSVAQRLALKADILAARGAHGAAGRAAREAAASGAQFGTLFNAGQALVKVGQPAGAIELAGQLDNRLETEPRVYGALLRGEAALAGGRPREALDAFKSAQGLADTWMGRFDLGRAYLALGAFAEASSEFDRCLSRQGEATAVFLDDLPTYRLMPPIYYYLGVAKAGLRSATAADEFRRFLAIKEHGDEQGLVADAKKRLQNLIAFSPSSR